MYRCVINEPTFQTFTSIHHTDSMHTDFNTLIYLTDKFNFKDIYSRASNVYFLMHNIKLILQLRLKEASARLWY